MGAVQLGRLVYQVVWVEALRGVAEVTDVCGGIPAGVGDRGDLMHEEYRVN